MALEVHFGGAEARLPVLCTYDFFNFVDRTKALGGMDSGRREQRNYLLHRTKDIAMGFHPSKLVLHRALCGQPQGMAQGRDFLTRRLPHRLFDFGEPIRPLQYFAGLGTIRGAHNAVPLHQVDKMRGAPVADA